MSTIIFCAGALFAYMSCLFCIALWRKNNGIADIGYGGGFIVVTAVAVTVTAPISLGQALFVALPFIWGVRLVSRIYLKSKNKPEDFRYKAWRDAWGSSFVVRSFFQIYMLQGLIIFIVASPIVLALVYGDTILYLPLFLGGLLLWCVGFFFESVGDYQLDQFIADPSNKGKIMMSGLWKYTRHPNYFGESMMWFAISAIAISFTTVALLGIISPLLITYLLLKVSGVPMLEKRWEGNNEWEIYKKKTSVFFPMYPIK
jgi:steroid 5-alpha reductase family enzyme